jgi:hypothetical protein
MSFTEVFGGDNLFPSQLSFLSLTPTANVTLQWPTEVALPGANIFPDILEVTPAAGLSISFPDARIAGPGQSILVNNIGANTISILDFDGNNIGSVASGEVWEFYLQSNTTQAGVWRTFEYGAGSSSAVAAALAGAGLKAITTTLNVKIDPRSSAVSPLAIVNADRARVVSWTGGVGAGTLLDPATVGNDWFVYVRNNGTGTWTITPAAGTVDGSATLVLAPFSSAIIYTDGANYFTLGLSRTTPSNFDFVSVNIAGTGDYTLSGIELNRISYRLTGVLTGNRNVIVPATVQQYWVNNQTSGAFTATVKTAAGLGIVVPQGTALVLYCDGTDVVAAEGVPTTGVYSPLNGGTGLSTYATGDIIYASAANVLSRLTYVATASRYLGQNAGVPGWVQVNLADGVTGLLPFANIADGSALSVLGRASNSAGVMASIAAGANDRLLTRVGDVLAFTQLTAGMFPNTVVPDAALSANVPLKNGSNVFSGATNAFTTDGGLVYVGEEVGFRNFPFDDDSPHTADYTLEANDRGKCIFFSSAHGAGDTVTIPSNASGTFTQLPVFILIVNDSATDNLEVAIDTDTLYLAGTTTTGPQNIKPKGMAIIYRTQTVEWFIAPIGNSIDYPASTSTMYAGYCTGSAGAAVAITPNPAATGWTVAQAATGRFTVTHNLNLASAKDLAIIPAVTLNAGGSDDRYALVTNETVNTFDVLIADVGAGAVDDNFYFHATRLA